MGKLLWIVAAGAAGYYGFRRLLRMEGDIRREIARGGEERGKADVETGPPEAASPEPALKPEEAPPSLKERIVRRITETPGILQTELYALFPEENRRTLQEALRTMDQEGRLKREREGGTFRLFPG